jgi:metallo-beta-lactamase class B
MKKLLIFLLTAWVQFSLIAQTDYKTIKISDDIKLIQISVHAYVHVSHMIFPDHSRYPCNGLIYIDENKAFLFDTPPTDSLTKILVDWLRDSMQLTIVGFIPNHWHNDCMAGLNYLQSMGTESYANQMTIDIAKAKHLPIPTHGFKNSLKLFLGTKDICCYYLGAAHSMDNIVVWIPEEKILFPGCMVKELHAKNLGNTADGDLNEYPKTLDRLLNKFRDAKIVIPGHGQFGGMELIRHTRELLMNQ